MGECDIRRGPGTNPLRMGRTAVKVWETQRLHVDFQSCRWSAPQPQASSRSTAVTYCSTTERSYLGQRYLRTWWEGSGTGSCSAGGPCRGGSHAPAGRTCAQAGPPEGSTQLPGPLCRAHGRRACLQASRAGHRPLQRPPQYLVTLHHGL